MCGISELLADSMVGTEYPPEGKVVEGTSACLFSSPKPAVFDGPVKCCGHGANYTSRTLLVGPMLRS
jgi:hypothetical protein